MENDERFEHIPDSLRFQRFQHDHNLGSQHHHDFEGISPEGNGLVYGDKSLRWHMEKLLAGLHEEALQANGDA